MRARPVVVADRNPGARGGFIAISSPSRGTVPPAQSLAHRAVRGILAFVFVFFLVPETKGRPLERIEGYWTHGRQWQTAERSNPETAATAGMAQE
jgi:hypothetical protein